MVIFFLKLSYLLLCIMISISSYIEKGEINLFLIIISLFMLAYFIFPIVPWKMTFLLMQSLFITVLLIISNISASPLLLLHFYLLYEGSNHTNGRSYVTFIIGVGVISVIPLLFNSAVMWTSYVLLYSLVAIICYNRASIYEERITFKEMYQNLLNEYRKLKRTTYEQRENARVEERNRIARDIHDSVGHQLTSLIMQIEMSRIMIHGHKEALKALDVAKEIASTSLNETRRAVKVLKNDSIHGIEAVTQLIKKIEADSPLQVRLTTSNRILNVQLSNEESVVLYRSIQECLTNVMRHAQTKQVSITLELVAERSIRFIVENPIRSEAYLHEGFGLGSLRERVKQYGGQISIGVVNGQFQVSAMIPLKGKRNING